MLGKFDRAAQLAPDHPEGWLAVAARDRDPRSIARARDRWVGWQRLDKRGPQHARSPVPLTGWDWIEESFRLEAELRGEPMPSHAEMLRHAGMLREPDEEASFDPPRPAPVVGFHSAFGDAGRPSLRVLNEGLARFDLADGRAVEVLRQRDAPEWGVRVLSDPEDDEGQWILDMSKQAFQDAALWAAEWLDLHDDREAAEAMRRLVKVHDAT